MNGDLGGSEKAETRAGPCRFLCVMLLKRCSLGNWLTGAGDSCEINVQERAGRERGRETDRGVKSVGRESSC